jgi:hypothetical protein
VRVFSTACDSAFVTSGMPKWRPFSFIFNWGNRKVAWVGDDGHVAFGQKFPGEKGSVKHRVFMMQQSEHISMQWPQNVTVVHLVCQENVFVNIPIISKKVMSMLLTLSFLCLTHLFLVSVSLDLPCITHAFFPERLSNHCQGLRRTFS